jgi:deoxycytidine triphosphate deaminase
MWSDKIIREAVWPTNGALPTVYVPEDRLAFGLISDQQIQPVSLDLRLADEFIRHPDGQRFGSDTRWPYRLSPGECVLASAVERFDMRADNVAARIEGKSSWARRFLTVHAAGLVDPGFHGDITLELKNDSMRTIELTPGVLIAQATFEFLDAPADHLYGQRIMNSHYQGQIGPTESRL